MKTGEIKWFKKHCGKWGTICSNLSKLLEIASSYGEKLAFKCNKKYAVIRQISVCSKNLFGVKIVYSR